MFTLINRNNLNWEMPRGWLNKWRGSKSRLEDFCSWKYWLDQKCLYKTKIKMNEKFPILTKCIGYTFGNYQRPVSSLGVAQHMHKITNLWQSKLQENNEITNHPCCIELCFGMPEAFLRFKFLGEKLSNITRLQRGSFLTMFYNINSSPVLFTK